MVVGWAPQTSQLASNSSSIARPHHREGRRLRAGRSFAAIGFWLH